MTNSDELVEVVARAIAGSAPNEQWSVMPERDRGYFRLAASAAIEAYEQARNPLGIEDVVERIAYSVANAKLGEGPSVRCEGPTDFEIDQARQWARRVFKAAPDILSLKSEIEAAQVALRWVYQNGMKPDHTRPKHISEAFDAAFASTRAALS